MALAHTSRASARDEIETKDWIAAGLAELAHGGVDAVRVEVLATRLGVTKGGFYRRFKDRPALLDAILQTWKSGRIAAITRQAESGGEIAMERLHGLIRIYTERSSTQGIAIELAIRQWARTDKTAAAAAAGVDAVRLKIVVGLYRELGLAPAEAEARAVMLYSFLFGQSLLFMDETARKRASLIAACARTLMNIE